MEYSDSSSSTHDTSDKRTGPSVSKEKWLHHALQKLSRGYLLIIGEGRRTANFYKPGVGYEMCAYNVAIQLVRAGQVEKAADHYMGTAYALAAQAAPVAQPPRVAPPKPAAAEDDELLDTLDPEGDELDLSDADD